MTLRYHLVLKYSDDMYKTKDVVLLHNQVALKRGAVWVGKPEHGMGRVPMETINKQIEAGLAPLLYLIDKKRVKPIGYFGELLCVSMRSPKEKELIPAFYGEKKILSRMKAWMKVGCLQGFYLEDFPALKKLNKSYELAVSFADKCSEYFVMYEECQPAPPASK